MKKVEIEKPEIQSAWSKPTGVTKLERETEATRKLVDYYAQTGQRIPPKLKAQLPSLKSNTLSVTRMKGK